MEDKIQEIVEQLKNKCLRLMELHRQAKDEAAGLLMENKSLKEALHREQEFITVLKEKNKQLQLAEAFKASSTDTNDAKNRTDCAGD